MFYWKNNIVFVLFLLLFSFPSLTETMQLMVVNPGDQPFLNKVVSYSLTLPSQFPQSVIEVREGREEEVAFQYNKENKSLLFLMPGLTKPGERRIFLLETKRKSQATTDLKLVETNDSIRISNTYFRVEHRKNGGGGFPSTVVFNISGNEERFIFEDRLYEKGQGYFTLRSDPKSTAKVISKGPLEIVIETKARYYENGRYAPGNARATYTYKYKAYCPYIEVSAKVEKDDDFPWSELHFLQISRKDNSFLFWAGGKPLKRGEFSNSRQGISLEKWAIMFNHEDAIGLYTEKNISLYDGLDYYNYIQETVAPFKERTGYFHAWIYLAPPPSDFTKAFKDISEEVKMEIHPLPIPTSTYRHSKYDLENEMLRIGFASEEDNFGVVSLFNKLNGDDFLKVTSEEKPLIWRLILSRQGEDNITIDNTITSQKSIQKRQTKSGKEYQLFWKNIDIKDEKGVLDVSVRVELPDKSSLSFWHISVDNRSKVYGLWEIHFPLLNPLGKSREIDVAVPRSNWGFLYRNLEGSVSGYYPSCDWPMQFLSLNKGNSGLYLSCYDPEAWTKSFSYKPGSQFYFNIRAENMGVAGSDFKSFPFVVGVYEGNWLTACKFYREWAVKNAPWTKRGPLTKRKDTPDIIKNLGLWMLGGGTREEVVPSMLKAKEFFQVPIGIHWYNWHQIGFDTEYPDYFPYKAGFPQGVKELTSRKMIAMPYINGRLWDSSLDSFKSDAVFWCTKQPNGEPYIEVYNPQVKHAVMCPYTKFWQDKVNQIVERLIKECGVNAIYIDQIGAAGSVLCFDRNHGHPIGGGGYWVSGYRELLMRVREKCAGKVAITTENNAEPYMDGVDAFLIWNPRHPDEIPMMTAVYSGYTIYFSSPTHGLSDTISFAMLQGRDFIWGCQLGWMGFELLSPEHKEKAEFLKTLANYRMASLKFIVYGELLGEITPLNETPRVKGTWFQWGGGTFTAELPAVMGTYWKGSDGTIGALIVNVSDEEQAFSFAFPKELLPKTGEVLISDISPQGKRPYIISGVSTINLSVPPLSVRILEFQRIERKRAVKLTPAYEYIIATGLEWQLSSDKKEVTEGEEYYVLFRAKANKPLNLVLKMDGKDYTINLDGKRAYEVAIPKVAPFGYTSQYLCTKGTLQFGNYRTELFFPIKVNPKYHLFISSEALRAGETSLAKISIQNNSSQSASNRLFLSLPSGWEVIPANSLEVNIPPREKGEFLFQIHIPEKFPPGDAKVGAYIGEQRVIIPVKVLPPSPVAECHYLKPPQMELLALKTSNKPLVVDVKGIKVSNWGGEEDLAGQAWLGWDEENFYFLAEVRDDIFHQPYIGKDIWQGDCIQLAFRTTGVAQQSTYEGVYEFGIAMGPSGEEVYQWTPREGKLETALCKIKREGDTTIYQLTLPWKEIDLKEPKAESGIGWAFTINENDGEGFRGWLEWAGGICGGKDASLFGKLFFKK